MSAMFSVVKGVPVPTINRTPKTTQRKYPVRTMAIGDMFFVPGRSSKSVSAYVSRITRDVPGKFVCRPMLMVEEGLSPDGTTNWRVAKPNDASTVDGTGVWRLE